MSFSLDRAAELFRPAFEEALSVPAQKKQNKAERRKADRRAKLIDIILRSPQTVECFLLRGDALPPATASNRELKAFIIKRHLDTDRIGGPANERTSARKASDSTPPCKTRWLVFGKKGWRFASKRKLR